MVNVRVVVGAALRAQCFDRVPKAPILGGGMLAHHFMEKIEPSLYLQPPDSYHH